ncbi:hypothetical protein E9M_04181 [Moraxella catarrhalis 46P47B1]|uniref:Uncharacterized protein n=1 Tax=Moraxella catarrhalis TaxID=480 RepID=A0A3Q9GFG9_MORCA|nr:hypothetical protein MCR_1004 [Moraxella catarrhalis BBH18]AZQ87574.1 hypothetical protein EJK52_1053 [Moraxella catarrhalis]EGE13148.1 hypothetical protein E9M_04181 [Moraxella catarrhalis 46P47B1]EGE13948.1 hypothetical protein E9K_05614 [Moraxella catarrhalis 103P14B1]EGE15410.1 hypothetical protein E9O_04781 [Moraxella catarrhalis 12P80B1]EGE20318.1 hypothetical protein E9U_05240 [Moraxella catarrhalis BC8]EGE23275.1 hypothetical protein E9Y_08641 [Moraxella catarrhalis 101P30B1]EGE25
MIKASLSTNLNEPPFLGQFGGFYCPLAIQMVAKFVKIRHYYRSKIKLGYFANPP